MQKISRKHSVLLCVAGVIAAVVAASFGGSTASAAGACSTATPFAQFGDNNSYSLLINGSIEKGLTGFQYTGRPTIATPNESYYVNSATDTQTLQLVSGDSATFHAGCLPQLNPSMRFFARAVGDSGTLAITIKYKDMSNVVHKIHMPALNAADYADWTPTAALAFLNSNKSLKGQVHGTVWLVVKPSGAATWQVDDLYIDPYKTK